MLAQHTWHTRKTSSHKVKLPSPAESRSARPVATLFDAFPLFLRHFLSLYMLVPFWVQVLVTGLVSISLVAPASIVLTPCGTVLRPKCQPHLGLGGKDRGGQYVRRCEYNVMPGCWCLVLARPPLTRPSPAKIATKPPPLYTIGVCGDWRVQCRVCCESVSKGKAGTGKGRLSLRSNWTLCKHASEHNIGVDKFKCTVWLWNMRGASGACIHTLARVHALLCCNPFQDAHKIPIPATVTWQCHSATAVHKAWRGWSKRYHRYRSCQTGHNSSLCRECVC